MRRSAVSGHITAVWRHRSETVSTLGSATNTEMQFKVSLGEEIRWMSEKNTSQSSLPDRADRAPLFTGVEYWRVHPTEANAIIALNTGFYIEDVKGILGGENNPENGTLYMYSVEEAARFIGVADGLQAFGQKNGQMQDHWRTHQQVVDYLRIDDQDRGCERGSRLQYPSVRRFEVEFAASRLLAEMSREIAMAPVAPRLSVQN